MYHINTYSNYWAVYRTFDEYFDLFKGKFEVIKKVFLSDETDIAYSICAVLKKID
jgi:hypothetical protein